MTEEISRPDGNCMNEGEDKRWAKCYKAQFVNFWLIVLRVLSILNFIGNCICKVDSKCGEANCRKKGKEDVEEEEALVWHEKLTEDRH